MSSRNRRGNRQAGMKARLGIATAVLVGGGAVGVAAIAASHSPATTTAQSAGFTLNFHHTISEQQALSSALGTWSSSQQKSMTTLAQMAPMRTFSQFWSHRTEFAAQRGVVVLATKKFLLVRSADKQLHLWWLDGATKVKNVSASATGMVAMTGNNVAAHTAMTTGSTVQAAVAMAGSTAAVNQMTAPVTKPTTITVDTGNQVITITITTTTATVTQPVTTTTTVPVVTATPTATATVAAAPTATATKQPVFTATKGMARGDLVFVIGVRTHGFLVAKLVLFAAPATATATSAPTPTVSLSGTPAVMGTHS